ncbi:galactose-6-phosphate isomerase subunit LacB [Vagococcus lutrae]|uniref:Galactose-6-phosphate isomerase subunit LacB n=1 Tax=Vagococcus lutrae TaxID=81947 RepID=A0AAF0BHF4_9ENTE|nr:galactose-6-phosphate isomerase subunit LacB [Vagococcus lutrae]WCG22897.1 galactose-6-phosphate isomerase subunit LacB [Vagococcus lutrae]
MKIALGCDHIVTDVKIKVSDYLKEKGYEVIDVGTYDFTRTHYPIFGKKVADLVTSNQADYGITLCGTGVGITTSAVKNKGARAVLVRDATTAKYSREHLDANILGMGGKIVGLNLMFQIIDEFLNTPFSNNDEDKKIIEKIDNLIEVDTTSISAEQLFQDEIEKWKEGYYHD